MSFIQFQTVKTHSGKTYNYIYLYHSFRGENGPTNSKKRIGTFDPVNKIAFLNLETNKLFIEGNPTNIELPNDYTVEKESEITTLIPIHQLRNLTHINYVFFLLLEQLSNKIGLIDSLSSAIPLLWKEIFMLACFLIDTESPFQQCADWID